MTLSKAARNLYCMALMGAVLAPVAKADDWHGKTTMMFSGPLTLIALLGLLMLGGALGFGVAERRLQWAVTRKKFMVFLLSGVSCLFIMPSSLMAQRAPVNLGSAGNFVVLSKTGITDVPPSHITGNIGASPISGAAIHLTCAEVTGTITAVDAAGPAPCSLVGPVGLGTAVVDMATAYTDAAGRTIPDFTELGAGNISGLTLTPGLYKWSNNVLMDNTGVTLSGGPNAVWIFQIAGDLTLASTARVRLTGGAQANNIFWQVGGPIGVTVGTTASISGTLLSAKQVIMNTGATLIGRALAQTQVVLQSNTVTTPGPLVAGIPLVVVVVGPPTVTSTVPANLATSVPIGNKLSATFSEAMDPATITGATFTLQNGSTAVAGTVTYVGGTATFTPTAALALGASFSATITTGAMDLAGNAVASNYVWRFTTGSVLDTVPPFVVSTLPAYGATAVTPTGALVATFNKPMDPRTITTATFTVRQGSTPVLGTVTYADNSATFRPVNTLAPNTSYVAQIARAASDLSGNSMVGSYVWTFTTGASTGQTPVCLANFAILAGSAITNTGNSVVTGNVGVTPGTSVTGFPPGTLKGTIYVGNDATVAQGLVDFSAAYKDAAGRSVGPVVVAGNLGGQTFTAGLYKSTSSLEISSGDLTLDAMGNVNAVFIFQMASTLTTTVGRQVILAGGAQAFNVFWQVGTSATLGANSVFKGSILADQSITLNTGATVDGRLAARTGSVTLQSNVITSPPPAILSGGIFDAANTSRMVSAGSIVSVFGNNLGSSLTSATTFPLLTTLGGTSFQIGLQAGPLFMTSCSQANVQIPWESAGQTQVPVVAAVGGLVSTPEPLTLVPYAPGIFSLNQLGSGQGAVEIAPTAQLAAPLGVAGRPVKRGEYIAIFCTGLGPVSNQPATGAPALVNPLSITAALPTVTIGGVAAQVTFSGLAPGFAGLYQVNALVPDAAASGDNVNLVLSIGGIQSNTVTIAVQ